MPRGSRFAPYISGGVGGGWIDSHANIPGAEGQDFTFNILSAAGISYMVNDHWKLDVGALYQHLSNGGQTDPNPSLNLFGPQVGVTLFVLDAFCHVERSRDIPQRNYWHAQD